MEAQMLPYANLSGRSSVVAYAFDATSISVLFLNGGLYLYNDVKPGFMHVARMKQLAQSGEGLDSYIASRVKENYAGRVG